MEENDDVMVSFLKEVSPYTLQLYQILAPYCTFKRYATNSRFIPFYGGERSCLVVRSGLVSLYRAEPRVLLAAVNAPTIMGMSGLFSKELETMLVANSEVEAARIPYETFIKIITDHNAWEIYAHYLQNLSNKLYVHLSRISVQDNWLKVYNQLVELMNEPIAYRMNTKVVSYICDKTHLSRSGVFKTLSKLREMQAVDIEDGILRKIHFLPDSL